MESNREYFRKVVDGTSKYAVFSERLEALNVLPSEKIEELSVIEKSRKEYGELYFYTNELMFGSLAAECEKVFNLICLNVK